MLCMTLENFNENSLIIGENRFTCNLNYLRGNKKENCINNIPIYEKIKYIDIYEGIDLIFYENKTKLEHDFIIKWDGDVNSIKINFNCADYIYLDEDGHLNIRINSNGFKVLKPRAYQYINENRVYVDCNFIIDNNIVSFKVDKYNRNKNLIINPILEYSSYLGGSGNLDSEYTTGRAIAVDENQCVYITSETDTTINFPITDNGYKRLTEDNLFDAYLIKIDMLI